MVSPNSADHTNWVNSSAGGGAQIGRSSVERFDTSRGYMAGSGASPLHDYSDYQARV